MIIKQGAELVADFLRGVVPDQLLDDPDVVIGGGSALSLYMANRILLGLSPGERLIMKKHLAQTPVMKFSDVDLWIVKDSKSPNRSLFQTESIDLSKERVAPSNYPSSGSYNSPYVLTTQQSYRSPYDLSRQEDIKIAGGGLTATKSSQWAITYSFCPNLKTREAYGANKKILPLQCIVKEQDSIESLLNTFDLGICSVAISGGEFHIHDSLFKSLEQNEITYNAGSTFKNQSFGSKLFQALRFMKYVDKTGFDLSAETYQDVLNLMIDASLFWVQTKKMGFKEGQQITVCSTGSNYEQLVTTKESIKRMISQLAPQFQSKMMNMKHYKESDALFLTDSDMFPVGKLISVTQVKQEALDEAAKLSDIEILLNELVL